VVGQTREIEPQWDFVANHCYWGQKQSRWRVAVLHSELTAEPIVDEWAECEHNWAQKTKLVHFQWGRVEHHIVVRRMFVAGVQSVDWDSRMVGRERYHAAVDNAHWPH